MKKYMLEIITGIVIICFIGVFLIQNVHLSSATQTGESPWGGTDDKAAQAIRATGYEPWIRPLWEPPAGEMTTLFFSLQAAIGALVIGYFFGYYRGRRERD
ncbi:MAG: energy-coupling factor ABC transporter substrate-binding protein [Methanoregula sp.]|nr:energy-coupling factor ABC transporter substrate-binding protein [Methanoregula sp.]